MTAKKKDPSLEGRDPNTGELPAPELTDAEIEARIAEKIQLQRDMSERRGARTPEPAPKPTPVDLVDAARLADEYTEAQAAIAGLEAAEKEAKKLEAEIVAKADAERKDRRQALVGHAEEVRARVAEVEKVARAQKLAELAEDMAGAKARNRQMEDAGLEERKAEYKRLFAPILKEIKATMTEGAEFLKVYEHPLRTLAAQTFATSPAEFPVTVRQKLAVVYQDAARLLDDINVVMLCGAAAGDRRWDVILAEACQTGKFVSHEGMAATIKYAGYTNRDHVQDWHRRAAQITERLTALTASGKAQSIPGRAEVVVTIDDTARQAAKRNAQYGTLTGSRQHQAERGSVFSDT